jgi:uncharacterized Zn-binding protein involved in type VI secretion
MPGVIIQGSPATCGDVTTGSPTVKVNGLGVTRVGIDSAGGLIIGPGAPTVLAEGFPVSLPNDSIVGHGDSPHNAPKTTVGSTDVIVGP